MKNAFIKNFITLTKNQLGRGKHFLHEPMFKGNEIKYLKNTIKSTFVSSTGPYINLFEKKLKKITKSKYVVAVINGTEALHISLISLGIKKGDEILVPSLTFIGTVNAISYCGADPHFIDSEISSLGIDANKLEKYLENNTKIIGDKCINIKTKKTIRAIIPVHIFGHICKIDEVLKIAKRHNLWVIEDAAEALGSYYKKKHAGTFGDIGCLSFNGNKIITTGGGGAILTNNKNTEKKIRHLITTAKKKHKWEFDHDQIGYNFRMPNINAALGLAQLEKLQLFLNAKKKLFFKYKKSFKKLLGLKLYENNKLSDSNYWLQTVILDKKNSKYKNKIIQLAHKKQIFLRPAWKLISNLKPYRKKPKMNLDGAKDIYNRSINLPSSQNLILK